MGKILPVLVLATALALSPLNSNAQTKAVKIIKDKTQSGLVDNLDKNKKQINKNLKVFDENGKIIYTKENHDKIVNMTVESLQLEYKDKFEILFNYYMLAEINKRREKLGVKPFIQDTTLRDICQKFSQYMAAKKGLGHEIEGKTSEDMGISIGNYKTLRENTTYENTRTTIFEVVDNRQYLDDKNDAIRGEKREDWKNHKFGIIANDSDRFGCGATINEKKIYIVMNSGAVFN